MNERFDNPLADFDGVGNDQGNYPEPDWDGLITGPCINVPGWADGGDVDDG